jgi:ACS family hexuronate transporter-like MFS transporter
MSSPNQAAAIGRCRWRICALLFFAATINYVDRQIHSLTEPILDKLLKRTTRNVAA